MRNTLVSSFNLSLHINRLIKNDGRGGTVLEMVNNKIYRLLLRNNENKTLKQSTELSGSPDGLITAVLISTNGN